MTLALPRAQGAPPQALLPAFDQQAAAALLVRMAAQKDSGASTESVVGWLDDAHQMMKSLAQYRKGDLASVPPPLAQPPQLIFHLRRSGVLRVAGFSPDRTAAFRLLASSLSVFSTLVLIQPTLTGLEPGRPPAPLPLDSASIAPSRTLLLDTFQQVVLCHGAHVAAWMKEKDPKENPELQKLLDDSRERAAALAANRFPAPGGECRSIEQGAVPDANSTPTSAPRLPPRVYKTRGGVEPTSGNILQLTKRAEIVREPRSRNGSHGGRDHRVRPATPPRIA